MDFLTIAGLLGNLLVLVWRCSKKETRHSLTSVLISSLAFVGLPFCCHFLLQELMSVNIVFASNQENTTIHVSTTDEYLCSSVLLFASTTGIAIMLTAVAIALATFLFHLQRYGKRMILCFLVISWMFCWVFGGLVVWKIRPRYQAVAKPTLDIATFSLFIVDGCTGSLPDSNWNPFPIIGTTLNAMASLVVAVIYIYLGCKLKKQDWSFSHSQSQEMSHFRIRLAIISGLNLLCWWPTCSSIGSQTPIIFRLSVAVSRLLSRCRLYCCCLRCKFYYLHHCLQTLPHDSSTCLCLLSLLPPS